MLTHVSLEPSFEVELVFFFQLSQHTKKYILQRELKNEINIQLRGAGLANEINKIKDIMFDILNEFMYAKV